MKSLSADSSLFGIGILMKSLSADSLSGIGILMKSLSADTVHCFAHSVAVALFAAVLSHQSSMWRQVSAGTHGHKELLSQDSTLA